MHMENGILEGISESILLSISYIRPRHNDIMTGISQLKIKEETGFVWKSIEIQ